MIVADTNIWIAYLDGSSGKDVQAMDLALAEGVIRMAPIVLTELLSDPESGEVEPLLTSVPLLPLLDGFWVRAGRLRAARAMRPKLADTLIAQICIDHEALLITRDAGFQSFHGVGLRLLR
jgi:predicted nucleic acid-binding protein